MTTHDLKTWPEFFREVESGAKTFEVRLNDRGYKVGDVLKLREWDRSKAEYTGRFVHRRVTYISTNSTYVPAGYCAMGMSKVINPKTITPLCLKVEELLRQAGITVEPGSDVAKDVVNLVFKSIDATPTDY